MTLLERIAAMTPADWEAAQEWSKAMDLACCFEWTLIAQDWGWRRMAMDHRTRRQTFEGGLASPCSWEPMWAPLWIGVMP